MASVPAEIPDGAIPIKDRETYYACPDGRIYSTFSNRFLTPKPSKGGWLHVGLPRLNHKPGENPTISVDVGKLICTVFHGECPAGMVISRRNGNHQDNRAENLIWESKGDRCARRIIPTVMPEDAIPIKDREAYYACPDGRIYSTITNQFLKQTINDDNGYLYVSMPRLNRKSDEGVMISTRVAGLICTAFHGERKDGMTVSHLNGDILDNHAVNLLWEPLPKNIARKHEHGTALIGSKNHKAKLTEDQVIAIRADDRLQKVIAAEYGINQTQVSKIKLRISWSHIK